MKKSVIFIVICCVVLAGITACSKQDDTISFMVIADEQYASKNELELAQQEKVFSEQTELFANVYFVESPIGMKYKVKWFLDNQEVKEEEKEMTTDKSGVIAYNLEASKVQKGNYKFQILFKNQVLEEKEFTVN